MLEPHLFIFPGMVSFFDNGGALVAFGKLVTNGRTRHTTETNAERVIRKIVNSRQGLTLPSSQLPEQLKERKYSLVRQRVCCQCPINDDLLAEVSQRSRY